MRHVTCTWCGSERGLSGTKLCDGCWEIKHRVEDVTGPVRKRILEAMGVPDTAHAYDAGWDAGHANAKARGDERFMAVFHDAGDDIPLQRMGDGQVGFWSARLGEPIVTTPQKLFELLKRYRNIVSIQVKEATDE